ncbi:MAG: carboxypeptidase regulatory-like domain-containing protein [Acidobacteria bacterium]|nr:carboxypeptidase regulatory-like domain-containing protein [Acidobacteriota bacterium]
MQKASFRLIRFFMVMPLLLATTHAQSATATIKGSVLDTTGIAVPGVTIVLTHTATGLKKSVVANGEGQFSFTFVEPSAYALEVQAKGFNTYRQPRLLLEVGQTAEINVVLNPGDVKDSVTVNATESVQLDTASSALGGVVERGRVDSLPLNGRNVFQLAQLEPGVNASPTARGANPDLTATGEITINGGRPLTNEFIVDGVPLTNKGDNRVALKPSVDSIQEFRIVTNAYSAEYGRNGGGALNFSTRAGSAQLRGTLWEFLRNDAFDARSFFVNANPNGVKEKLRYHQFGGNLGGPVYLPQFGGAKPGLRKNDKLFFFFNYEVQRISQSLQRQSTVPTVKMRSGDFSELLGATISGVAVRDTQGNLIPARIGQIYVPGAVVPAGQAGAGSRIAFANNRIPDALINPVAKTALNYYPLPNAPGVLNSSGLGFNNNYVANTLQTTDARQYTVRIDYNFSPNQQIYGRVIKDHNRLFNSGPFPTSIASPQSTPIQNNTPGTVGINYVNTLTPKIVLHLNAGATRFNNDAASFSTGFDPTSLGLPAYLAKASGDTNIFPTFNPNGYTSLGPPRNFGFFSNNQDHFSFNQDLSVLRGRHSIKAGANERVIRAYNYRPDDPAGNFTFSRAFTTRTPNETLQQSGDAIASFLLGNPASGRLGIAPQIAVQSLYYAFFAQDDWTLNRRLTLNLGLRWEVDLPNTERFDRLTNFDYQAAFPVNQVTVDFPLATGLGTRTIPLRGVITPVGRGGVSNRENFGRDINNWGPRIGLAFKLTEKTVLRAGGGIYYGQLSGGGFNTVTYALGDLAETAFIASLDNGITPTPGTNLSNPFPAGIVQPTNAYTGPLTSYGQQSIPVRLRETKQPFIGQWNVNLQRELPGDLIVQAAYAGSVGAGLLGAATDLNQLSPESLAIARTVVNGQPIGNLAVPNPFLNLPAEQRPPATSILGRPTITIAQLLRPYPQFGNVVSYGQNLGHSSYHSLQLKIARRLVDGLTFTGGYTFSKLIDDLTSNSINLSIQILNYQDYHNLRADKSLSNFDVRHRFVGNLSWELPFGNGRRFLTNGLPSKLLGGFTFNTIVHAQSGLPLSISATNASLQGLAFIALRPNLIGDPQKAATSKADRLQQYFNTLAFQQPALYSFGNTPRTLPNLRGPGYFATSVSLLREFKLTERTKLQFRAEAFNVFNRANFAPPGTTLGAANFGIITSTEDPRQIQFAARLYF